MDTAHLLRDGAAFALKSTAAASALVAVAAALFALLRTNSLHSVRTRVWRMFMGPPKCTHQELARALQDRDDLIQFRYFLGIQARTVKRAAAIAEWTRKNDEEPADVYDCDTLFDRERCRLKEESVPGRLGLAVRGVALMCALLYFIGPWFMLGLRSDQVLVPIDESLTTWFWLSEKSARSAWGSEILTPESCSYGVKADVPPWPDYAAMTNICNSFADARLKSSIANIAALTRVLLFMFTAPLLPFLWSVVRWARAGIVASRMLKRLRARDAAPGSASTDNDQASSIDSETSKEAEPLQPNLAPSTP